jgi:hypothetical protein
LRLADEASPSTMHRHLARTTLSLMLAGCAGGAGMGGDSLTGPPSGQYRSAKSPAAVAQCVVDRWKVTNIKGSKPVGSMRAEGAGMRAELRLDNRLDQVLLIEPQAGGSVTRRWTLGRYFGDTPVQVVDIEACQ